MDLGGLARGERIVAGAGTALAFDLALLPWHRLNLGVIIVPRTAVQWPNAPLGVVALVLVASMVTLVLAERARPWVRARASWLQVVGAAVPALLVAKLMLAPRSLGYAAFAGVALGALVAYGARLVCVDTGRLTRAPGP